VRRIAFLSAVALLAFAGVALAVTNKVSYTSTVKKVGGGKPTPKKPLNISYTGTLDVTSDPPGQQPDVGPVTDVFFAKQLKQNAKYFPSCNGSDIDGKDTFPAKCNKAVVGTGKATAYAGSPGGDLSGSIKEDLNVKAVNGAKGKQLLLVVSTVEGAAVPITNRVVTGTLKSASGDYGYEVQFVIPDNLQEPVPGVKVALTHFSVKTKPGTRVWKAKGKKVKGAYLQLTGCPAGSLPTKATVNFKDSAGAINPVTSEGTYKC